MRFSKNWFLDVSEGVVPNHFGRQNCFCSSTATLPKNSISNFRGLGEEERTRFRKTKIQKKEKKLISAKSGTVKMKRYLKTYNHVKYFLPYFSGFWMRPFFTPNLRGGSRVLKSKSRDVLPRYLLETYNLLILKLLSKFHIARSNRSRVISKNLKLRSR